MYVQKMRRSYLKGFVATKGQGERRREVCRYMRAVAGWRDRPFYVDDAVIAVAFTHVRSRLSGNIGTLHLQYATSSIVDNYTAFEGLMKL
jgi:hypothetical protein